MRKSARVVAFNLIFEYLFKKQPNEDFMLELMAQEENKITEEDANYVKTVYHGVMTKFDELTKIVQEKAVGFTLDRIFRTDMAILLLAIYEIKYMDDIPNAVSVNEAMELAKKYGAEKSTSFINGILASVIKG